MRQLLWIFCEVHQGTGWKRYQVIGKSNTASALIGNGGYASYGEMMAYTTLKLSIITSW